MQVQWDIREALYVRIKLLALRPIQTELFEPRQMTLDWLSMTRVSLWLHTDI